MNYNTIFTEAEMAQFKNMIDELVEIRNELIRNGFNPPWSATRGWEYAKVIAGAECAKINKKDSIKSILDIGSMSSVIPFYFNKHGWNAEACDVVPPNEQDLDYYKKCHIPYKEASIMALPYDDESFNAITSVCVLEHIYPWKNDFEIVEHTIEGLREAGRVLKRGGIMAHSCDYYVPEFNSFRTYHKDLLLKIIDGVKDILKPFGKEPFNYDIPDPRQYYINNCTQYLNPVEREEKHLKVLREGNKPENLFTCALITLVKK
jgi:SAM-dependent methyltransferase